MKLNQSKKQTGDPIVATEWNDIVEAINYALSLSVGHGLSLSKTGAGLVISATDIQPLYEYVYVRNDSEEWVKDTWKTLPIYAGTQGSESDTGEEVTAYNRWGTLKANGWGDVRIERIPGKDVTYSLMQGEC